MFLINTIETLELPGVNSGPLAYYSKLASLSYQHIYIYNICL